MWGRRKETEKEENLKKLLCSDFKVLVHFVRNAQFVPFDKFAISMHF